MKRIGKFVFILIMLIICFPLGYKIIGTTYCYVKSPSNITESHELIKFCNSGVLFFDDLNQSVALAKIVEKYPDEFQNEGSATLLITYYVKNNLLKNNLSRMQKLNEKITEEVWKKEKSFYILFKEDYIWIKLPKEYRNKSVLKIYEKYRDKVIVEHNNISLENWNNQIKSLSQQSNKDLNYLLIY